MIFYSAIITITLLTFLALKEIFSATEDKRIQSLITGLNVAIIPLLFVLIVLVIYKIISMI